MEKLTNTGMPRILLATQIFAPPLNGGSVILLHEIYKRLPEGQVVVLAPWQAGCEAFDQGQPYRVLRSAALGRLGKSRLLRLVWYAAWLLQILRVCRGEQIEAIHIGHSFTGYEGLIGLIAGRLLHIPCLLWVYGEEITKSAHRGGWREGLGRFMLRKAAGILTISAWTREKIGGFAGSGAPPIAIVTPGVDMAVYQPNPQAASIIRHKHELPPGPLLLAVSRLEPRKGLRFLIEAMPAILARHPQASLVIAGRGPEENALRGCAAACGVQARVIFAGFVPTEELPLYYAACDIFVVPTLALESTGDTEGFGMVFNEANACGKPVVAGRSGATEEAVEDGVSGLLIDVNSAADVAGAALRLLDDPAYAAALAENGLERVRRHFTWDAAAAQLQDFCTSGEPA